MTGRIPACVFATCALALAAGVFKASRAQSPAPKAQSSVATSPTSYPDASITNGALTVHLYLPDAQRGFYRSTRFDWSGVIDRVEFADHQFYGKWFTRTDPPVRDFVYTDSDIVAGAQSSVVGPAEEFRTALGYAAAAPGGTFVKIGVGVLRKADAANYSPYANYEIVDAAAWTVDARQDSVTFRQRVNDEASGYGYEYEKTVRLVPGRADMVISHSLRNIGRLPIQTQQYNHNFLMIDGAAIGPDYSITVPFAIQTTRPPDAAQATIEGGTIHYAKPLAGQDRVTFNATGFGANASDYDIRVENRRMGAGVRIVGDRPLASLALWSIRSVLSMEPFVDVSTAPGATTTWALTYTYYTVK